MILEALTENGARLQRVEQLTPAPQGTEVLLRVSHCGVCHSDLHIQDGYFDLGGGNKLDLTRGRALPFVLGHEINGIVEAIGPDARGVKIGDKVVAFPWIGCGACSTCARGDEHLCPRAPSIGVGRNGGFADHVLVPHSRYLLDPSGIADGLAAICMCSGLTAFSALKKIPDPKPADDILIVGAGGVGLMALQFAKALFPSKIRVADISAVKRAAALESGADAVYDPTDKGAVKQILSDTDGGVYAAVDFVGAEASVNLATNALRRGSTAIIVGLFGGALTTPIPLFPLKAMGLRGSYVGSLAEAKDMLGLVKAGRIKPIPIEERPLAQAQKTLDDLRAGHIVGRVVLRP